VGSLIPLSSLQLASSAFSDSGYLLAPQEVRLAVRVRASRLFALDLYPVAPYRCSLTSVLDRLCGRGMVALINCWPWSTFYHGMTRRSITTARSAAPRRSGLGRPLCLRLAGVLCFTMVATDAPPMASACAIAAARAYLSPRCLAVWAGMADGDECYVRRPLKL
jgi:hypothetical protein